MTDSSNTLPAHPYWIDFSALYERSDAISQAYHSSNLVFFLGSGASRAFARAMPDWNELLRALLSEVRTENKRQREEISKLIGEQRYLLAAEAIKQFAIFDTDNRDRAVDSLVSKILKRRMNDSERNPILHLSVLDFSVPVFTTNFDNIIESLIAEYEVADYRGTAITYEDEEDAAILLNPTRRHEKYVFKLHGSIDKTQRLILDEKDYSDFYFHARWPTSLQLLRHTLASKMVVFIGFSLSDPDIMLILREATRYSSSYQHMALLHEAEITSIERRVLRSNHRVDPILYEDHSHLPLYIMEMRNFYHREDIALQLKPEKQTLGRRLAEIKEEVELQGNCSVHSTILFGSFAKYGNLSQSEADIDVLFLTDDPVSETMVQSTIAGERLGERRIDPTVIARSEFEGLLRCGDSFASSILVTGCPLEDPDDQYGILARGFRGNYRREVVLRNAEDRYRVRWLRLCICRDAEQQNYLQACHQWSITLMQLFIIEDYCDLDSLLRISLLGNARYTIRKFATRFDNVNEEFFIKLMRAAKGILPRQESFRPGINEMIQTFIDILRDGHKKDDLEMLFPGEFIQQADLSEIAGIYRELSLPLEDLLEDLPGGEMARDFGYPDTYKEKSFLEEFGQATQATDKHITTYDCWFFLRLHELVAKEGIQIEEEERLLQICHTVRDQWLKEVVSEQA